ncbi:MAG: protein kinase, partial [Planctomycetaceae bacterium]|nr:protein kinase [Planctomycetaceae bacterium]
MPIPPITGATGSSQAFMAEHPSKEELSGFLLGQLPADTCDVVAEHVEQCPPCQQTIHDLEEMGDTLVEMLRKPDVTDDARSKQVIERVVAVIQNNRDGASQTQNNAAPQEDAPTNYTQAQLNIPPRAVFEKALKASGAIDDEEWNYLRAQLPEIDQARDAAELAKVLVQHGALTKFQATLLYQSKSGLRMGEYIVLDQIGAGGMGQVFKARHRRMDRVVAIKVLAKSAMNSPEAVKRFQREVKAAAKLSHPNIVHAYDAGEQDGVHFLVMEYVAGHDLSGLIKQQGPLPLERVMAYLMQAARGLAFAHSKGVVHRDIKPANLLLDTDGTVKILDMGLARIDGEKANLAALDGLTQSGQVMGTVDYMAPEQAFDTRTADAKADVYSLGCTVHRLLTGRNAYDGETLVQKILAHREQPIPALSSPHGVVSAAFDGLYRRMMAKKPEARPTMAEVVTELESIQKAANDSRSQEISRPSVMVEAPKPRTQVRGGRGSGRGSRPPLKYLAAAAGAAALLFFGVWIIVRDKDGKELARVEAPEGSTVSMQTAPPSKVASNKPTLPKPATPAAPSGDYALSFDGDSKVSIPHPSLDSQ